MNRAGVVFSLVSLTIVLAMATTGCRPEREEIPLDEWPTLPLDGSYEGDNFRIDYPTKWHVHAGDEEWPVTSFGDAEHISLHCRFGVGWFDADMSRTMKEEVYVRINLELETSGAKVIHEGPTVIAGMEGYEVIIIHPGSALAPLFGYRDKQWQAVIRNEATGKGFSLAAGAYEDDWDKAWPIFEAMRDSFKVK